MCCPNVSLVLLIPLLLTVASLEMYDNFCPARQFATPFKIIEAICAVAAIWCAISIAYERCRYKIRKKSIKEV